MRVWATVAFSLLGSGSVFGLFATIVLVGVLSQRGVAQKPQALLTLDDRSHRELRRELQQLFDPERQPRWAEGFRFVDAMGSSASPVVRKLLREESNARLRLLLVGAAAVAERRGDESQFAAEGWLARAGRSEQVLALLALAIGRPRAGDGAAVRRLALASRDVEVLQVAGCLALARFVGAEPLPAAFVPVARRDDPGLLAAAAASGVSVRNDLLERWWSRKDAAVQRQLVLRGCFLGGGGLPSTMVLDWALATVAGADVGAASAAERTAALYLAARADVSSVMPALQQVGADVLVALGSTAAGRALAQERGWSRVAVPVDVAAALRPQLAALHALSCPVSEIGAAIAAWRDAPELQATACLALAWRRLAGDTALTGGDWLEGLIVPERGWLRWALGQEVADGAVVTFGDAGLQRAWTLALRGDLPPAAAASELEAALWRRGGHPGRVAFDARIELVRDLLLRGSSYVRARMVDSETFPYLPDGIPPDDEFYPVAFELLLHFTQATLAPPAEYRLRR